MKSGVWLTRCLISIATVMGGMLLDLGRSPFGQPLLAYGLVFCIKLAFLRLAATLL
jgi:MFS transporter, BCD family, chlorophyll transporter